MSSASRCRPSSATRCRTGCEFADAIGIGLAFQTAHFALFARGDMKDGETVLVTGATGGVGISTVALAKACGATVIAGCASLEKVSFARQHGADYIVMLDRPDLDSTLKAEIAALTDGRGADIVVDNVGGPIFDACLRSLAWCGRIVVVGFVAGAPSTLRSNYLLDQEYLRHRPALERLSRSHAGIGEQSPAAHLRAMATKTPVLAGDQGDAA